MKVFLVEPRSPEKHVFSRSPLIRAGLPLLATILQGQGYEVEVISEDLSPEFQWFELQERVNPEEDIVGISAITATAERSYLLADWLGVLGITTIMGGVHPTFMPNEALQHCDYVAMGEAERTLLEFLEMQAGKRDRGSILGLAYKNEEGQVVINDERPLLTDSELDELPYTDWTTVRDHDRMDFYPIVSSRGCPYACTFCSVTPMFGRGYRYRSPENVLGEIEEKKPKRIFFYDDMFNANRSRSIAIMQGMIERGLVTPWTAQVRTNVAKYKDREDVVFLTLAKLSGAFYFYIGLESINPVTLKAFKKGQNVQDIVDSIKIVHKYNIMVHGMFVLGADDDTLATVRATTRFAIKNKIDTVQFMILTPLPGSGDYKRMEANGEIVSSRWRFFNAQHVLYNPKRIAASALQAAIRREYLRFYSPTNVLRALLIEWKGRRFVFRLAGAVLAREVLSATKGDVKLLRVWEDGGRKGDPYADQLAA